MDTGLEHLHSTLRWVALILLAVTWFRAFSQRRSGVFSPLQAKLGLFTMVTLHLQLLLGLSLYFLRGWHEAIAQPGAMSVTNVRFFGMEHLVLMLLAITLGTLGHSLSKRAQDAESKYRKQALFFGLALLVILLGVPWPFRPGFEGYGWF